MAPGQVDIEESSVQSELGVARPDRPAESPAYRQRLVSNFLHQPLRMQCSQNGDIRTIVGTNAMGISIPHEAQLFTLKIESR